MNVLLTIKTDLEAALFSKSYVSKRIICSTLVQYLQ